MTWTENVIVTERTHKYWNNYIELSSCPWIGFRRATLELLPIEPRNIVNSYATQSVWRLVISSLNCSEVRVLMTESESEGMNMTGKKQESPSVKNRQENT